ncbi:NAD-dependent epimerase/dehydratase family protein [Pseudobutyrivibrio sp.]|uniref:NAD-dependent epimerase/dehydratase family protein n=1 Tax=Pseudobutyrivibrio sp. TaxID=2014367 RepID=UPI001D81E8EB|nr:NAD(P)-dependent oxidoreductase [Pseudobutyrivibrio sp.]MBE5910030.1 NAD(P)-dependent oxidoreductase [Pseudobutyrivibrio sp.]
MRVIVTGAAGFAGYSLTRELLEQGHEVYAILRPNSKHNDRFYNVNGNLHLVELDCVDFDKIADKILCQCDVFYHLAWFGGRDDFEGQNANIDYTIKAIESAAKSGCKRFVGIGSQAEYGVCEGLITEDQMPRPINAYGAAKVAALYLSKRRAEQLGVEWIWGRIFSLYGDLEPAGRMLPDVLDKMKHDEAVSLSSCEQNWDYLHVVDAAKAIAALGKSGHAGEIYNIANGNYAPLMTFIDRAKTELKSKSEVKFGERVNPFISLQPDVSKIKAHTGWSPKICFEDGIVAFVDNKLYYEV